MVLCEPLIVRQETRQTRPRSLRKGHDPMITQIARPRGPRARMIACSRGLRLRSLPSTENSPLLEIRVTIALQRQPMEMCELSVLRWRMDQKALILGARQGPSAAKNSPHQETAHGTYQRQLHEA